MNTTINSMKHPIRNVAAVTRLSLRQVQGSFGETRPSSKPPRRSIILCLRERFPALSLVEIRVLASSVETALPVSGSLALVCSPAVARLMCRTNR